MKIAGFSAGAIIGTLGGLIGLGGAEFRLPLLVGIFKFDTLNAIVINLIVSFITVAFALFFRSFYLSFEIANYLNIIVTLLSGTLIGSYFGANLATKVSIEFLNKTIMFLLVFLGFLLIFHDFLFTQTLSLGNEKYFIGVILGLLIGLISSMLGVAGGELLIPTIFLLFGVDIKIAGTLSLIISLPTILVALFKYFQRVKINEKSFTLYMGLGSIVGAFIGSLFLGVFSEIIIRFLLGVILIISAIKLFLKGHK